MWIPTSWPSSGARLYEAGWACIGFGKDVAKPGDVVPRNLLGLPLILVRDTKNEIRVFHNVCSHRGAELRHRGLAMSARS